MKYKSFFVAILATFALLCSVSSYALDIYLKNSSVHNVLFFKFPNGVTYGPVRQMQEVKLPGELVNSFAAETGEVFYASNTGLRSCGTINFATATAVSFRVGLAKQCHALIV